MNPFKSSDITDRTFRPSPPVWQVVMDHAVELDRGRSLLHLDRFLINVMSALADDRPAANHLALPSWLRDALATLDDPANIADVDTFVAAANRSPEHVARVVRQTLGTTPTDLVNAARVRRAAHRLVSTDDKILAIALDCGFNNLGHFYTIFRKQMGQTPRRYRVLRQNVLGVR